jgi:hypothetical protein
VVALFSGVIVNMQYASASLGSLRTNRARRGLNRRARVRSCKKPLGSRHSWLAEKVTVATVGNQGRDLAQDVLENRAGTVLNAVDSRALQSILDRSARTTPLTCRPEGRGTSNG